VPAGRHPQTVAVRLRIHRFAGGAFVLWGGARRDVARIAIRFEDGRGTTIRPVQGGVLYAPTRARLRPGHRPARAVVTDRSGGTVLSVSLGAERRWR